MSNELAVVYRKTTDLIPYVNNSRTHSDEQVTQVASSIKEFGFTNPLLIDEQGGIIAGHGRLMAANKLGLEQVPTITLVGLSEAQRKAYVIADNKLALNSGWDNELLALEIEELKELDFDIDLLGFDEDELADLLPEIEVLPDGDEDEVTEPQDDPVSKLGDIWQLGSHRLMCGDSTSIDAVEKLMDGQKADMVFTDPPYGMKKEKDGVLNDNLNFNDLLEFNRQWIPVSISATKGNGSWYCWGIDEPLMDMYSHIIKPMIENNQATFRNLITWDKGHGQGQNSELTRSYAVADEKCLFIMLGVQGFDNNSDNYFEGFEVIRSYLVQEKERSGLTNEQIRQVTSTTHTHYWSKSQWVFPTKEHYETIQRLSNGDCFKKQYDCFKKQYDEIKKQYDEIKKQYYSTRAYFNNTHDNFNNVWHFDRHQRKGDEGGHATPKPIPLCERGILSSSRKDEIVLDVFGGSGSTLIACEKIGRKARLMELDERYVDVIIKRWQTYTGKQAVHIDSGKTYDELAGDSNAAITD